MNIPGFIDLQINGYAGFDFQDPETSVQEVLEVAEVLVDNGTIGFLATVTTNLREVIEHCIATLTNAIKKQGKCGHILGIHLEGPFISSEYGFRGAHPEAAVCPPDLEWFQKLQKIAEGNIRLVTLAPEHNNAEKFIHTVTPDVLVSVGHSNCSYQEIRSAVRAGLSLATHVGNSCRQTIDRHDNPIMNILACPEITLCFIADGLHLPEAFIRVLINSRPIEKLIVVSDSVKFAGLPVGMYSAANGSKVIKKEDGRLCLASDPDVMAGSSFNMMECMNNLAKMNILSESALWQVGYFNPLRVLGIDPGTYEKNKRTMQFNVESHRFELV